MTENRRKTPGRTVADELGGIRPTARALEEATGEIVWPSTVYDWLYMDSIPSRWHIPLLRAAEIGGRDLTPEDLIFGREEDE